MTRLALLAAVALGACAQPSTVEPPTAETAAEPSDPIAEARAAALAPGAQLVDVRTPEEVAEGRAAGALHADVLADDFEQRIAALDLDPDRPVYLYCRSGNRSGQAAEILTEMGLRAVNVGGLDDLVAAGAETTR